jgi:hypothetical protein
MGLYNRTDRLFFLPYIFFCNDAKAKPVSYRALQGVSDRIKPYHFFLSVRAQNEAITLGQSQSIGMKG